MRQIYVVLFAVILGVSGLAGCDDGDSDTSQSSEDSSSESSDSSSGDDGAWVERTPMRVPRYSLTVADWNGTLMAAGGLIRNVDGMPVVELYDPEADTWTDTNSLDGDYYRGASHAAVINDVPHIFGGETASNHARIQIFDADLDEWYGESMPIERIRHALVQTDGAVYLFGGDTADAMGTRVDRYDEDTGVFTQLADMPSERYGGDATAVGQQVVMCGAFGPSYDAFPDCLVYDIETDTWSETADKPTATVFSAQFALDGEVYVTGGVVDEDQGEHTDVVEVYNPETDTWRSAASLPVARARHAAISLDGRTFILGGTTPYDYFLGEETDSLLEYLPENDSSGE